MNLERRHRSLWEKPTASSSEPKAYRKMTITRTRLIQALQQVDCISKNRPEVAIADRGYRGKSRCGETEILTPKPPKKGAINYEKRKVRQRFRRRAAIEPRIGHLKSDFQLGRNFLKGQKGDAINLLLAAEASNMSLWMRKVLSALYYWLRFLIQNPAGH